MKSNKQRERNIAKFKSIMDDNSDQINTLELINKSIMESMVKELKELLDDHFGLNAKLINTIRKEVPWDNRSIQLIQDRLDAYYDLKVNVIALRTQGYGSDVFLLDFVYDKVEYQLSIPNLRSISNYQDCYGGYYRLHYRESKYTWSFVDGVKETYYLDELIDNFKKSVGYTNKSE